MSRPHRMPLNRPVHRRAPWAPSRRRDEQGVVAIISAMVTITLLVVSAFVVDLGMTWQRRGKLQSQADQAAIFAAQALPATDAASQLAVAKRVAFHLACNPVPGQAVLNPSIPSCPSSSGSSSLDTYAQTLLTEGLVTFPSSTQVQVITPQSEVKFAFAGAVGVEDTVQTKAAVAKVSSPGELLPVGLSLQCLAGIVNQAGLGASVDGILPLSYITPGNYAAGTTPTGHEEPPLEPWSATYTGSNASTFVSVQGASLAGDVISVQATWPSIVGLLGVNGSTKLVFKRGSVTSPEVIASDVSLLGGGTVVGALPQVVRDTPGVWYVKIKVNTLLSGSPKWSHNDTSFTVYPKSENVLSQLGTTLGSTLDSVLGDGVVDGVTGLTDFAACARLLDSPRTQDGLTPALPPNLQEGLDHALTANQALLQALSTQNLAAALNGSAQNLLNTLDTTVRGVINDPTYALLGCAGSTYNRLDTQSTWQATQSSGGAPANCVRLRADAAAEQEFTDGMLNTTPASATSPGYGRLSCSRDGACDGASTSLPGFAGTFNDDALADFLKEGASTILDRNLAFGLDTYLLPKLPLITPNDNIEEDIYGSPRFGWVPVLSYLDLNSDTPADYPVLTFRPIFIDNGAAPDLEILGLNAGGVVDRLGVHLESAIEAALAVVRDSLGILGSVLDGVLTTLGIDGILADLAAGDVSGALEALGDGLSLDMGTEKAGLVLKDGKLKAARFMTIAPDALPPVSTSYDGPVTDYLGVGPKIIRLVR